MFYNCFFNLKKHAYSSFVLLFSKKMSLKEYKEKRRFDETPEPEAMKDKVSHPEPVFVVQKHAASRLHFDFRFEADGVLKSWAVPKGPSMNPKDKRLAVQVEDHPLSYADFEGVIPEGNYGAGTVEIWDSGTYTYKEGKYRDVDEAIEQGVIELELHGRKLKGAFDLVRTGMDNKKNNWLLIKKEDAFAVHAAYQAENIPSKAV